MKVNTVMGTIDSSELGATLIHEHITFADWSMRDAFGSHFFEEPKVEEAAAHQFKKAKEECGITTIVDATPINLGRDVTLIHNTAKRSGVNVVVSSGFYFQEEPGLVNRPEDSIYHMLLAECQNGIDTTGILPGMMKAASDMDGMTPYTEKLHHAIGRVGADMDLPIFCHHAPATKCGLKILDILKDAGMKPERIVIGHSGDTDDMDYLHRLLERGCYIGLDRFGYCTFDDSFESRVKVAAQLCREGYAKQLFLSHDLAIYMAIYEEWDTYKEDIGSHMDPDYTFIHKKVLPALEEEGIPKKDIDQMLVENPRNLFEGKTI